MLTKKEINKEPCPYIVLPQPQRLYNTWYGVFATAVETYDPSIFVKALLLFRHYSSRLKEVPNG